MSTLYAPAERLSEMEIHRQYKFFAENTSVKEMMDAIKALVVIVNRQRQIVFTNKAALNLLNLDNHFSILGQRPGEVFNCIHAFENQGGCGTSEACRNCGAVNTVLQVISSNEQIAKEFRLTQNTGDFHNFLVHGSPYQLRGEDFFVVSLQDISDSQRKLALERIFFHDILNVSGGLRGLVSLIKDDVPQDLKEDMEFIHICFEGLVEEIIAQRQLLEAENGSLQTKINPLEAKKVLEELQKIYQSHQAAETKEITLQMLEENVVFNSDYSLIKRIIGNMLKNALEETAKGGTVTLGYSSSEEGQYVKFWVHNKSIIPREIQLQLFQRFFSTKGSDRGLGTYSMKLLGEKYLGGKVSFTSNPEEGTIFYLALPKGFG